MYRWCKTWVQIKIFEKTMGTDQFDLYPWFRATTASTHQRSNTSMRQRINSLTHQRVKALTHKRVNVSMHHHEDADNVLVLRTKRLVRSGPWGYFVTNPRRDERREYELQLSCRLQLSCNSEQLSAAHPLGPDPPDPTRPARPAQTRPVSLVNSDHQLTTTYRELSASRRETRGEVRGE